MKNRVIGIEIIFVMIVALIFGGTIIFQNNDLQEIQLKLQVVEEWADMYLKQSEPESELTVQPTFIDMVQTSLSHVVHIKNETQGWQGSGVAISEDTILTARHVLENGVEFTVTDNEGNEVKAYKAISHSIYDIGFLKVVDPNLTSCELATTKDLRLGQDLFVIGSPYGKINFNSVTKGIVSGIDRDFDFRDWNGEEYGWTVAFTTDSSGFPGNSGCPVFTADGKVRGILVGGFSPTLIIAMPVDLILHDIEEIEVLFTQLDYYLEEEPTYEESGYYNYKEDNEYYRK